MKTLGMYPMVYETGRKDKPHLLNCQFYLGLPTLRTHVHVPGHPRGLEKNPAKQCKLGASRVSSIVDDAFLLLD